MVLQLREPRWLKKVAGTDTLVLKRYNDRDSSPAAFDLNLELTSVTPGSDFLPHVWAVTALHPGAPSPVVEPTTVTLAIQTSYVALSVETAATPEDQYGDQLKLSLSRRHTRPPLVPLVGAENTRQLHTTKHLPTGYSALKQRIAITHGNPLYEHRWCINLQLGSGNNVYSFSSARMTFIARGHATWDNNPQYVHENIVVLMTRQLS
jgi:hypothetical protein